MVTKELIKELIVSFQNALPLSVISRETVIPTDTEKIITLPGVRRCGKSSVFMLTINEILSQGVDKERILYINFDDDRLMFEPGEADKILEAYRELYPEIPFSDVYVFFDEIQELDNWAKFVRREYDQESKRVFITGSNAKLLSSELATSLRGRALQYEMFPLSFSEFCMFKNVDTHYYDTQKKALLVNAFADYLDAGGFPEIALSHPQLRISILQDYYFAMIYKDLIDRYQIRNAESVKYFNRRVLINATKPTSINKIVNEIKSQNRKFSKDFGYELISQTEAIYLFLPLTKYDPSYVKEVQSVKKYYSIDTGFFRALLPFTDMNKGVLLENAVFLHLRRQETHVRRLHFLDDAASHCDFVWVENGAITQAIQVAWDISDVKTYLREIAAFEHLKCDDCLLITADEEREINEFGKKIRVVPAWKYLLSQP